MSGSTKIFKSQHYHHESALPVHCCTYASLWALYFRLFCLNPVVLKPSQIICPNCGWSPTAQILVCDMEALLVLSFRADAFVKIRVAETLVSLDSLFGI